MGVNGIEVSRRFNADSQLSALYEDEDGRTNLESAFRVAECVFSHLCSGVVTAYRDWLSSASRHVADSCQLALTTRELMGRLIAAGPIRLDSR